MGVGKLAETDDEARHRTRFEDLHGSFELYDYLPDAMFLYHHVDDVGAVFVLADLVSDAIPAESRCDAYWPRAAVLGLLERQHLPQEQDYHALQFVVHSFGRMTIYMVGFFVH
jgi:hypothetical protein